MNELFEIIGRGFLLVITIVALGMMHNEIAAKASSDMLKKVIWLVYLSYLILGLGYMTAGAFIK